MSLKFELQKIDIETIVRVNKRLQERLDASSPEALESEMLENILAYPALNELAGLAVDQGLADGLPLERAIHRGTGASHVLLVLTTIAEIGELPPL